MPMRRAIRGEAIHRAGFPVHLHARGLVLVEGAMQAVVPVYLPAVARKDHRQAEFTFDLLDSHRAGGFGGIRFG